eukprot:753388-Hanusia_phi.AAC.4
MHCAAVTPPAGPGRAPRDRLAAPDSPSVTVPGVPGRTRTAGTEVTPPPRDRRRFPTGGLPEADSRRAARAAAEPDHGSMPRLSRRPGCSELHANSLLLKFCWGKDLIFYSTDE